MKFTKAYAWRCRKTGLWIAVGAAHAGYPRLDWVNKLDDAYTGLALPLFSKPLKHIERIPVIIKHEVTIGN